MTALAPLETWRETSDRTAYTAEFWNDMEVEKTKPWYISSPGDPRLKAHLDSMGFLQDFETVSALAGDTLSGQVLDVAAGTCWLSAMLSRLPQVSEVHAVDFSWHRLNDLAPVTIQAMEGDATKIVRCFGSFYDIKRPDGFFDAAVLCSAFHHADRPLRLLSELDRVLKPGGVIILMGEHRWTAWQLFRRWAKFLLLRRQIFFHYSDLFPPHHLTGDHYYSGDHYKMLMRAVGREPIISPSHNGESWNVVAR